MSEQDIHAKLDRIDFKLRLLFAALENVRVLQAVRDGDGDVVGIGAQVAPPMIETSVR